MNSTYPLRYRIAYHVGTVFQFIGYALVVIGTWLCGGDGSELVEDETK